MSISKELPRCSPESRGVDSSAILAFVEEVEKNIHELHSFMLLRHGAVIAEGWWSPYSPERPHMLFSLSKSFTSTAVGMAVAEGLLSVDDQVLSFFPGDSPAQVSENLAAMRVKHLLSMNTGHDIDATLGAVGQSDGNWIKGFLEQPVDHAPGTHFVYNSAASYLLSAIVQKLTGMTMLDYLQPRLFEPLGITGATWETSPQGINTGGWGLTLCTEDIARFGQLYLQKGSWEGRQLLPESWITAASSRQSVNGSNPSSDWEQGYGYQFWLCRHNIYRGDGAFGQFCVIMPDQDAVLAITGGVEEMQPVLDIVWDKLLPGFSNNPLPENQAAQNTLEQRLRSLALPMPVHLASSAVERKVSGREFYLEPNGLGIQWITFDFFDDACLLTTRLNEDEEPGMEIGGGEWAEGESELFKLESSAIVASGAWIAQDTYLIHLRFIETPYLYTIKSVFNGDKVSIEMEVNVSFGSKQYPTLIGKKDPELF